ncbi:Prefoldin [Pontoporia blainvillei]|uniref:Prefoldin n=1 Tax=Pontoporia blainvillei TaxID=48723 RepID=A0ABX0SBG2_PONBL|nr:Prefoldin [Pontoporia blainvillei]
MSQLLMGDVQAPGKRWPAGAHTVRPATQERDRETGQARGVVIWMQAAGVRSPPSLHRPALLPEGERAHGCSVRRSCRQVQDTAVFPKGCFEEPWLQEVILEKASVRRTREKPPGTGEAPEGAGQEVQASLWTGSERLGLQMASDLGAEMMLTESLHSPPQELHPAPPEHGPQHREQKALRLLALVGVSMSEGVLPQEAGGED